MAQINSLRSFLVMDKETAWNDGGAGSPELWPVLDGDYSVGLDDPVREQPHVVGDQDSQFMVQDVRNLGGDLKIGAWPHLWKRVLDFGAKRTSGVQESYAGQYTYPGIEARKHFGLTADRLAVSGQNGGDIMFTLGLIGSYEETAAAVTYPGTLTVPSYSSLLFKNCRFVISLDAGSAFANRITPVGLESFEVTLQNSVKRGPAIEDRINAYKDGMVEFLEPGRRKVDLRYTAAFDRIAYSTLQRNRLRTQFKMVGAHQGYTTYGTVASAAVAAGSNKIVTLAADPSAWLAVGDYVYFDNADGSNLPCVGIISAITPATPSITITTLDEDVEVGDHVFAAGIEIKTAPCLVQSSTPDKPFDDYIKVTVNGQAFSGGSDPFTYKAKDLAVPA